MVSAVVRVSLFDVPYLAVTLPHILKQTKLSFAETIVLVDPDARRGGSEKGERAELDRILAGHRVVELPVERRAVHERYFGAGSPAPPDADRAIFSTLCALEAARHDLVVWLDADVLFHATGDGWVAAGLKALRDENVWFAATRSGPSRFSQATSGHFVCDRRRLYGKLRWVTNVLGDAGHMKIVDGGWHLRTRSHARPYPQWIEALARAVERGDVPASQRDGWLHLDDLASRSDWRKKLGVDEPVLRSRPRARLIRRRSVPGALPITVIVPIRNRAGADVRNALASLAWQRGGRPFETIVVSHGSDPAFDDELRKLATETDATLITAGTPADPWCKPLALNTGIRASDPSVPFVMTMDADMILADNLLETVLAELADPQRIVLCRSSDLPEGFALPEDIRAHFDELRAVAALRGEYGTGGIQAMRRSFLVDVRGYDEDMLWWGALDTDLVRRAEAAGLSVSWVTERTAMLHQWHPRKHVILDATVADAAQDAWLRNHEIMNERKHPIRNQDGWGATFE